MNTEETTKCTDKLVLRFPLFPSSRENLTIKPLTILPLSVDYHPSKTIKVRVYVLRS
jgi:hypothetical protein